MKYIVILGSAYCSPGKPPSISRAWDGRAFDNFDDAKAHGFSQRGSDDFNIGVVLRGELYALMWMHESLRESPDTLARIAGEIGLPTSGLVG